MNFEPSERYVTVVPSTVEELAARLRVYDWKILSRDGADLRIEHPKDGVVHLRPFGQIVEVLAYGGTNTAREIAWLLDLEDDQ